MLQRAMHVTTTMCEKMSDASMHLCHVDVLHDLSVICQAETKLHVLH